MDRTIKTMLGDRENVRNDLERNTRLAKNTVSALVFQIVTVICGFVLPKAILSYYGSEVNGLVNSIAQFLQVIAFLELGVGAVVQSALYKPLAVRNEEQISKIMVSGNSFFKKIAYALTVYVILLVIIYPRLVDNKFGYVYDITLIISMSISYFAQYYFGLIDSLLISADQREYIKNIIYTVTLVINTVVCYILIICGFSIQMVKLTTSVIFLIRPVIIRGYINKNYTINRKITYKKDPIEQKWNGIAQHIAAIVLDSTDTIVLSLLSTLENVSVYSVYNIVVSGIKQLFSVAFGGVRALLGELWAKNEIEELNRYFHKTEWVVHLSVVVLWCCTYKLIVPFVLVYTRNVHDANYNVPIFALLLCIAYAIYCLRLTYNVLILAVGHYKQTQNIFIIAACINLISSIILVKKWGLIGVAVGTIAGMLYQTFHMQYYCIKKLNIYSYKDFAKQLFVDLISIIMVCLVSKKIYISSVTWFSWLILAIEITIVIIIIVGVVNRIFYKQYFKDIVVELQKKIMK